MHVSSELAHHGESEWLRDEHKLPCRKKLRGHKPPALAYTNAISEGVGCGLGQQGRESRSYSWMWAHGNAGNVCWAACSAPGTATALTGPT